MKIVGKYVCQVEIDLHVDENTPGLLPFDEIDLFFNGDAMTKEMYDVVSDAFIDDDEVTVTVTKVSSMLRRVNRNEVE